MGPPMARRRHVPRRTCIGCREVKPKRQMIRVVRTPEGDVAVDATGKRSGRGAYICPDGECLDKALSARRLESALKISVTAEQVARLKEQMEQALAERPAVAKGDSSRRT